MAQPAPDPTYILKVDIACDKPSRKKLKKELPNFHGVTSVFIDEEKNLVYVTGRIDIAIVVTMINELIGKEAKVMTAKEVKSQSKKTEHRSERISDTMLNDFMGRGHKAEPSVAKAVDKKVCRDIFCKSHYDKPVIPAPYKSSIMNIKEPMPPPMPRGGYLPYHQRPMYPPRPPYGYDSWNPAMPPQGYGYGYRSGPGDRFGDFYRDRMF